VVQVRFSQDARYRREAVTGNRKQSQIESSGAACGCAVAQEHQQSKTNSQYGVQAALQTAWRSNARQHAHPQAQIAGRHMHEQPFENVAVPAQVGPPHPARVIEVSIGSLQQFAPSPHQLLPALARNATPIGIHRVALGVLIDPVLPTAIRFTDVGPQSQGRNSANRRNITDSVKRWILLPQFLTSLRKTLRESLPHQSR